MERTVAQTIAATVQNTPSQASSTTVFQTSIPNTIQNGSPKIPADPTIKPMECDPKSSNQIQPTTSKLASTNSAKPVNDINPPKSSPAKSQSKSRSKKPIQSKPDLGPQDCKVEVSGYPAFAKPQDLYKIFSSYGPTRVEHVGRKFAVIAFDSKEVANEALNDSKHLCLYGQFLNIKPFKGVVDDQKKQVYKSKHTETKILLGKLQEQAETISTIDNKDNENVVTVPPESIPLTGSFGEQLGALLTAVRLTQEEVTALAALYSDLERVMQSQWPGCQAMPFGSITTGLGVKSSDADCFMNIPPEYRYTSYNFVHKARRILQQYPDLFAEVFAIPRANTPIVKLFHLPTKTHCDLTFKTPLGALNSKLVAFLLHADPRFLPLAVVVKYWASVHGISGSGKLTNYALTLMLIFYLQTRGLLPAVAALQRDADPIIVDGWNTGFLEDYNCAARSMDDASIVDLLGGFYKYYDTFDFENLVACPYLGHTMNKAQFLDTNLPEEFQRYKQNVSDNLVAPLRTKVPVCVQDPFEQCHNVASSVTPRMAEDLRVYIRFAAEFYEKDKANDCKEFLPTILLVKPKLIVMKTNPEYRLTLYPKLLDTIDHQDWKGTLRKTIFTIFERMLKLKLKPIGEKETTRNGREKEKYVTTMNKPLWKRKQLSRIYDTAGLGFIERHVRVTEAILNAEHVEWAIEFQVILSFCTKIRSAWISIRLTNGDVEAFFPFGKYFLSTMQSWIIGVLHASGDTSVKENLNKLQSPETVDSSLISSDLNIDNAVDIDKAKCKELPEVATGPQATSEETHQDTCQEVDMRVAEEVVPTLEGETIQSKTSDC